MRISRASENFSRPSAALIDIRGKEACLTSSCPSLGRRKVRTACAAEKFLASRWAWARFFVILTRRFFRL